MATYHKDVEINKNALILDNPSNLHNLSRNWVRLVQCAKANNAGSLPMVVAIHSNAYYHFYYLNNGDRIDDPR